MGVNQTSTNDSLGMYYQSGRKINPVYTFPVNWETDVGIQPVHFDIVKTGPGEYRIELFLTEDSTFRNFSFSREGIVPEFPEYFGLSYSYTSSKDRLLQFDDFEMRASFFRDTWTT